MNLEYQLPNGQKVKFLDDQKTYLGNQLESEFRAERCFGILANMDFILVCRNLCYGIDIFVVSYERNSGSKGKNFRYMIMMFFIEISFRK